MGRSPCCEKIGLKKGPWTPQEDQKLLAYIDQHGHGSWRALPENAGLQRCGKSCRLRWANYLRPDIKRGKFSLQEEQTIIQLHALLGNRWSAIATHLPKRTDNEIKNYWNTHIKKRLDKMGIDPVTHKPKNEAHSSNAGPSNSLSHMAQWESARLEAEARLARQSKLQASSLVACRTLTPTKMASETDSGCGDLESPTSTISYFKNVATVSKEKSSDLESFNNFLLFPDSIRENKIENAGGGNFNMVRFTDLLLNNSGSDAGNDQNSTSHDDEIEKNGECGHYEDNKNYWNDILNLINSSPSDSSVF